MQKIFYYKSVLLIACIMFYNNTKALEFKSLWKKKENKTLTSKAKTDICVLTIKNHNGNISINKSNGKEIEIKAFIKGEIDDINDIEISQKYDSKNKYLTIFTKQNNKESILDVNYEISIPEKIPSLTELKINAKNGDINITDFDKSITIDANKSKINIENSSEVVSITLFTGSVNIKAKKLHIPNNIFINIENYAIIELNLAKSISSSLKLQTHNGKIVTTCPVILYPPIELPELNAKEWNNLRKNLSLAIGNIYDESKLAPIIVQTGSGNITIKQY